MIKLQKVSKNYQHESEKVRAVSNISIEIKDGEFIAITGPSGSGKSTLLHLIGALDTPSKGTISISDIEIQNLKDKELSRFRNTHIGFIFQSFHLHPNLTVLENIKLPLLFSKKTPPKTKKILKAIGLDHRSDHLPNELSGGEKQRTAIGRALINNPKLLLADEPTGNLDSKTGQIILDLLLKIHKENKTTMIIVTHDDKIAEMADRVLHIKDGQLSQ